ncbi:hypothetical protein SDC9_208433 [bioreactor metagenome]|uniref:Uncharacterized protein n=1 Tax=bioreactor metagenome TaxID=1076179 RepID=A0A645JC28_9ZZZZ
MRKLVKVNGCKLLVNVSDMAFMSRLAEANKAQQAAFTSATVDFPDDDPQAQYKRVGVCVLAVCKFYDDLYGAGTADRVFHRTNDAAIYLKAGQEFSKGLEAAVEAFTRGPSHTGTLKVNASIKRR